MLGLAFCFNFWLRPWAKDLGITQVVAVVVVVALFHLSHFLFKRNQSEKIILLWESNQGPLAPKPITLSTELLQHCYIYHGKLSIKLKDFKNQPADLAPVLAVVSLFADIEKH